MKIHLRLAVSRGMRMLLAATLVPFIPAAVTKAQDNVPSQQWTIANPSISFEENHGQFRDSGQFTAQASGFTLVLERNQTTMKLRPEKAGELPVAVRMAFSGGNATALIGAAQLPGVSHYLYGSDPQTWVRDVRSYQRVLYEDVYPGIDLVFRNDGSQIEYDFIVAPGADPSRIKLSFSGIRATRVDASGDLVLETSARPVRQRRPKLYQEIDGTRHDVDGEFVLQGKHEVGFRVGPYDHERVLIIDPVVVYSTLFGGSRGYQGIQDVTVDSSGNAYAVGFFPWNGDIGSPDVFVAKFGPTGRLLFRTTFGGVFPADEAGGIALDSAGNIYVTGSTSTPLPGAPQFPTTPSAFQPVHGGGVRDAFLTKLDPTGTTILYSTFLGGAGDDSGSSIEIGADGRIHIVGVTTSPDFPTAIALQPLLAGAADAFVTVFDPTATALIFSTYLGGSLDDRAVRLVVSGDTLSITGTTSSLDFPIATTLQPVFGGGASDAFLARISAIGALLSSTYLGGSADDEAFGIAVDRDAFVYVAGNTNSADFPTARPLQPTLSFPPDADVFLTKLAPDASSLVYSTYLAIGTDARCVPFHPNDPCGDVGVDARGDAFITAGPRSTVGVFVLKVHSSGMQRLYTFNGYGGEAIAVAPPASESAPGPRPFATELVIAGQTAARIFPVLHAVDPMRNFFYEFEEGWLMKLLDRPSPRAEYEETDPRIIYTGTWERHLADTHSGGAAARSAEAGARATITFTGTGIQLIGHRDPSAGNVMLTRSFDATPVSIDTYASPAESRALVVSISNLTFGTYSVTFEVQGTHNSRSSADWFWIDGFRILGIDGE